MLPSTRQPSRPHAGPHLEAHAPDPSRAHAARGFTLVELMVSVVVAMLLAAALLALQSRMGQQLVRNSDVAQRDDQARVALDRIVADLAGAGFLLSGTPTYCSALLTYNAAAGAVVARHPVDAAAVSAGTALPYAPSITPQYPPAGVPSDVLVLGRSANATRFNDAVAPVLNVAPSTTLSPMSSGVLPLYATAGLTAGDAAVVQVNDSGKVACFRVPLTSVGVSSVSSSGATMPGGGYSGFAAAMLGAGFTGPLSDAELYQGRIADLGAAATSPAVTTAYYVDLQGGIPTLMRASFSLADDSAIGTPQAIAAGVVSLQVRFGVDPGNTGAVTEYDTAATVSANKTWDAVRSVRVLIVSRPLIDDPDPNYTWPSAPRAGVPAPFTDFNLPTNPTDMTHRRYAIVQSELAVRSVLWK